MRHIEYLKGTILNFIEAQNAQSIDNNFGPTDFTTDPALSMCVNPTDVFAAGVSTTTAAAPGNDSDLATLATGNISAGSDVCCKDVVINSGGFGRRRSSGARSLVSLPPGMIVDSDAEAAGAEGDEDMLMDEINWDKLL